MKPKTTSLRWLLGTALLAASAAQATEPSAPTTDAAAPGAASVDNGVRAYVDPATGKLRQATPAERAEEARQSAESARLRKGKGVKMDKRANGAVHRFAPGQQLIQGQLKEFPEDVLLHDLARTCR